jgi:phage baseplate assembly protein W
MATDFGQDLSLWPDIDNMGALVNGTTGLAQALCRRLTTPRGGLSYDPGYGTDMRAFLNEAFSGTSAGAAQQAIEAEVIQDERVLDAVASVTFIAASSLLIAHLTVRTSDGPFLMVLAITALTVAILKAG